MKLSAPAKVNLSLRILGQRPDGYHDIETLIAPLDLADEIEITSAPGDEVHLTSNDPTIPVDERNLAVRAVLAFNEHVGIRSAIQIYLQKRIPHGAGLGGGSSDAATVLLALNELHGTNLPLPTLESLAATIGSDVPFFVRRQPAWARGRGEILEPATLRGSLPLVLIKPPFGIETPWAYQAYAESKAYPGAPTDPQTLGDLTLVNDLERPAFQKFLLLPVIKTWLLGQPETRAALMSGSGSTLFAIANSETAATALADNARHHFGDTYFIAATATTENPIG
jgi:4-diphosphocytidyl-2-C-methyl-D-erythritol kinase